MAKKKSETALSGKPASGQQDWTTRIARAKEARAGATEGAGREAGGVPDPLDSSLAFPSQSPLFHAQHSERYARQGLIAAYEERFGCRFIDDRAIFPYGVTLFEELLVGADARRQDLHLLLDSPGETARRPCGSCGRPRPAAAITVIVPNQAKSAGTLLAIGAHHIVMGPTSDLGPVDPQFQAPGERGGLYSAKDLIAAVEAAERAIAATPDTYPLHASLLADFSAVMVQQARSALDRTNDLVREALQSNPDREPDEVARLTESVREPLIDLPHDHGAVFGASDAGRVGLPIKTTIRVASSGASSGSSGRSTSPSVRRVYEGRTASQIWADQ